VSGRQETKDPLVTVAALAEHMGWSRQKAGREMSRIGAAFPGVVQKRGRALVADAHLLAPHVRGWKPTRLEQEVAVLRAEVKRLSGLQEADVCALVRLQEMSRKWFERIAALESVARKAQAVTHAEPRT